MINKGSSAAFFKLIDGNLIYLSICSAQTSELPFTLPFLFLTTYTLTASVLSVFLKYSQNSTTLHHHTD